MGKVIYNEEIKSYYKGFPVFGNLTDLQLYYEEIHDWDDVVKILQNCSKLQILKIKKVCLIVILVFYLFFSSIQVFLKNLFCLGWTGW
jgi:hypothetical protein